MNSKILIVEDDPGIGPMLCSLLERRGHVVVLVRSLAELASLDVKGFNLAICDYHLPDADGTEIITFLRQRLPSLPVILSTGSGAGGDIKLPDQLFTNVSLLAKPFQLEELQRAVTRALIPAKFPV